MSLRIAIETKVLPRFAHLAAGNAKNFGFNLLGLLIVGIFYSFTYSSFPAAGLVVGLLIPGIWIACIYKLVKHHSEELHFLMLPNRLRTEPLNSLLVLADLAILAMVWLAMLLNMLPLGRLVWIFAILIPAIILILLRMLMAAMESTNTQDSNA